MEHKNKFSLVELIFVARVKDPEPNQEQVNPNVEHAEVQGFKQ